MSVALSLLILLIVACVLYWATLKILAAFGIGDPIATVVQVLLVIFLLFAVLDAVGLINVGLAPRLR